MELSSPSIAPTSETIDSLQKSRPAESPWTFVTNHANVLLVLSRHPSMVLREVAARIGITERAVQRIILELEQAGYIAREKVGRQNYYQVNDGKKLRHAMHQHCLIRELLDLLDRNGTSHS